MDFSSADGGSVGYLATLGCFAIAFIVILPILLRNSGGNKMLAVMNSFLVSILTGGVAGIGVGMQIEADTILSSVHQELKVQAEERYGLGLSDAQVEGLIGEAKPRELKYGFNFDGLRTVGSAVVVEDGEDVEVHLAWSDGVWILVEGAEELERL